MYNDLFDFCTFKIFLGMTVNVRNNDGVHLRLLMRQFSVANTLCILDSGRNVEETHTNKQRTCTEAGHRQLPELKESLELGVFATRPHQDQPFFIYACLQTSHDVFSLIFTDNSQFDVKTLNQATPVLHLRRLLYKRCFSPHQLNKGHDLPCVFF